MHYFITGTDTDAGKTYVTCLLIQALRDSGRRAIGYKPLCCGGREDVVALHQASGSPEALTLDDLNPVWLRMAASPLAASMIENRPVDPAALLSGFHRLAEGHDIVLVEGAGGWEAPIRRDYTIADLAAGLGLPVIVVVNNKLGALNHTILTVKNLQSRGLTCAGLLLNHVADMRDSASIGHRALLEDILRVPVLAEIMHGEDALPHGVLEQLWP